MLIGSLTDKIKKIPNFEKFTLSPQTNAALVRTLRCHANLIEEFLQEEYQFVLTAEFQSDPVERRFGQYRLKSGGRFLISVQAKDISTSEKILKVMSLVKEGFDIDKSVKIKDHIKESEENLLSAAEEVLGDVDSIKLNATSKSVSHHVAGYIYHISQETEAL